MMTGKSVFLSGVVALSVFILPVSGCNSASSSKMTSDLDAYFDAKSGQYMGSVAVLRNGKFVYRRQTGFADVEGGIPAGPRTKYMIGSITKTFTAVLVFQAVNEGLLRVDDPLEKFFPGAGIENAGEITIDLMMHHQSGISDPFEDQEGLYYTWNTICQSREDLLRRIVASGSDFRPGTSQAYCNANYILLTFILEDLYGKSYPDMLLERICTPWGLKIPTMPGNTTPPAVRHIPMPTEMDGNSRRRPTLPSLWAPAA